MTATVSTQKTRTIGLCLEPLDVLFFRDGRPFAPALRGESALPTPQTLTGAIRTHLLRTVGCDFERLKRRISDGQDFAHAVDAVCQAGWIGQFQVRGPWLARMAKTPPNSLQVLVPVPSTLRRLRAGSEGRQKIPCGAFLRHDPLSPGTQLPGWKPEQPGMRPLWLPRRARTERVRGFLAPHGLQAFLSGGVPDPGDVVRDDELYALDHRTGIGVHPDRLTAKETLIYGASFLALRPRVSFYAEVHLPPHAPDDLFLKGFSLAFGGESRRVRVRRVDPLTWPEAHAGAGQGTLLLLTTPGLFAARWRPDCLADEDKLIAASVSGYQAVSGWDSARGGPKPTRFAVPAGSVYFTSKSLDQLPGDSLADSPEDQRLGWGCYLTGVWDYV